MATLVYIDISNALGEEIADAIGSMRDGLAVLRKLDGMRAQTIADAPLTFGSVFGITDATEAQAFSDRWAAIAAGNYTGLNDFLDATITQ